MRIKIRFKKNTIPISFISNSDINSFIQKLLGYNNKWHGKFSPYAISSMHNGILMDDKTIQYPNGGYIIVSSSNSEFISDILIGLMNLPKESSISSMEYDCYEIYEPKIMSDYSVLFFENVFLEKKVNENEKQILTYENCKDYVNLLRENSIKKLIKEGIKEKDAYSIEFLPFHEENWKVKYCKYKKINNHYLIHPVSNVAFIVKGNVTARKMLCNLGIGNSTGYGFGFVKIIDDKEI